MHLDKFYLRYTPYRTSEPGGESRITVWIPLMEEDDGNLVIIQMAGHQAALIIARATDHYAL
jgi:hypothetical protein